VHRGPKSGRGPSIIPPDGERRTTTAESAKQRTRRSGAPLSVSAASEAIRSRVFMTSVPDTAPQVFFKTAMQPTRTAPRYVEVLRDIAEGFFLQQIGRDDVVTATVETADETFEFGVAGAFVFVGAGQDLFQPFDRRLAAAAAFSQRIDHLVARDRVQPRLKG